MACRGGGPGASASSDILGARGLMLVEALDASCGTHELPPYDEVRSSKLGRSAEPSAQQLFWAPQPLRQLLRSCTGGAPLGGQPWKRLPARIETAVQQPAPASTAAAATVTPAMATGATAATAGRAASVASGSVATPPAGSLVASPMVMSPGGPLVTSPTGVRLSGDGGNVVPAVPAGGITQSESTAHTGATRLQTGAGPAGNREDEPHIGTPDVGL